MSAAELSSATDASDVTIKRGERDETGFRHVHMAGDLEQGRAHNGEPDLWASMLRKKIGVNPEKMGQLGSETSEVEAGMSRAGSQAALLGVDEVSSSGVEVLHSPHHHDAHPTISALHHQSALHQPLAEQPRAPEALSGFRRLGRLMMHTTHLAPQSSPQQPEHQTPHGDPLLSGGSIQQPPATWQRVMQSTRVMAAFKKKSSRNVGGTPGIGLGSEGQRLQTPGSTASDLPLLPAGLPSGQHFKLQPLQFINHQLNISHVTICDLPLWLCAEMLPLLPVAVSRRS